jgi:hypothetical protein
MTFKDKAIHQALKIRLQHLKATQIVDPLAEVSYIEDEIARLQEALLHAKAYAENHVAELEILEELIEEYDGIK